MDVRRATPAARRPHANARTQRPPRETARPACHPTRLRRTGACVQQQMQPAAIPTLPRRPARRTTVVAIAFAPAAIARTPQQGTTSPSRRIASCSTSLPPRRTLIASRSRARPTISPIAARPNTSVSTPRNEALSASSTCNPPIERTAIEQDRLLRQPLCRGTVSHRNPRADARRCTARQRAIEPLRGLCRDRRPCICPHGERAVEPITSCNAA